MDRVLARASDVQDALTEFMATVPGLGRGTDVVDCRIRALLQAVKELVVTAQEAAERLRLLEPRADGGLVTTASGGRKRCRVSGGVALVEDGLTACTAAASPTCVSTGLDCATDELAAGSAELMRPVHVTKFDVVAAMEPHVRKICAQRRALGYKQNQCEPRNGRYILLAHMLVAPRSAYSVPSAIVDNPLPTIGRNLLSQRGKNVDKALSSRDVVCEDGFYLLAQYLVDVGLALDVVNACKDAPEPVKGIPPACMHIRRARDVLFQDISKRGWLTAMCVPTS